MLNKSSIGWTDYSGGDANFIIGCTPASEGCKHCYAASWAERHRWDFSDLRLYPDKLDRLGRFSPEGPTKRGPNAHPMVFVVDMGDLFHEDVPEQFVMRALDRMAYNSYVDWQILTKRPRRALQLLSKWGELPDHMWFGVTCENQRRLDERLPVLREIGAQVRWLSLEPMLGPIEIPSLEGIDWIVVGAESGDARRPFDVAWARSIRDACQAGGVSFFYKQGSGRYPGTDPYLDGCRVQEWPTTGERERQLAFI